MPTWESRSWEVPSETQECAAVLTEILENLRERNVVQQIIFAVRLALEEALVNAVEHGEGSTVSVQCRVTSDEIWVRVVDQGIGFNPDEVPDSTADEHLDTPGGRGILLMRAYMQVTYPKGNNDHPLGSVVEMTKPLRIAVGGAIESAI